MPLDLAEFSLLTREHLQKLEVYAFATCAQEFRHPEHRDWPRPWIEHFGNEHDIVARLGMLAPRPRLWRIRVDGARYEHPGAWGHLLNAHYLTPIGASQKHGHRRGGCGSMEPFRPAGSDARRGSAAPRLFAYINGGRPAA